jgi:hypothetical protein
MRIFTHSAYISPWKFSYPTGPLCCSTRVPLTQWPAPKRITEQPIFQPNYGPKQSIQYLNLFKLHPFRTLFSLIFQTHPTTNIPGIQQKRTEHKRQSKVPQLAQYAHWRLELGARRWVPGGESKHGGWAPFPLSLLTPVGNSPVREHGCSLNGSGFQWMWLGLWGVAQYSEARGRMKCWWSYTG